jgi:hypothetical protein
LNKYDFFFSGVDAGGERLEARIKKLGGRVITPNAKTADTSHGRLFFLSEVSTLTWCISALLPLLTRLVSLHNFHLSITLGANRNISLRLLWVYPCFTTSGKRVGLALFPQYPQLNSYTLLLDTRLSDLENKVKNGDNAKAMSSDLYQKHRLPIGLDNSTGVFHLQRASHARDWIRPGCSNSDEGNGELIFQGMTISIAVKTGSEW